MQQTSNTTPLPLRIHLQAIDRSRNIARDYRIEATRDLFGHIIVELHWGRIGTRGQGRCLSFAKTTDATHFLQAVLARRKRARSRIGVAYLPVVTCAIQL
jgi:predicted DNA-binding WGR domain protein